MPDASPSRRCSSPARAASAGALAARLVWGHPRPRAGGDHVADGGRPAPRRDLSAPPGAARARRSSTSATLEEIDAAIVAYPHGAAAPLVAELRELGARRGRPLGRLPPARPRRSTSAGTASTGRRTCSGDAVYGLTELNRDAVRERRAGREPRLLPDRRAAGAGAARRGRADRRRRRRRQVGRLRRRSGRGRRAPLLDRRRELQAVQGRGPPALARARAGASRRSVPRAR